MHKVNFSNAKTGWNEALPMGKGHFGTMLYFEDNKLTCAMNHYDVYYKKLAVYNDSQTIPDEPASFNELKERAIKAHEDKTEPGHYSYNYVLGTWI